MDIAVKNLPDSVEAMYKQILTDRIFRHENKSNKVKARLISIWLTYTLRPLTLRELACAASSPEPRKVLEICTSSVITLQREEDCPLRLKNEDDIIWGDHIVQFDHFSVKEYLVSEHLRTSGEMAYFYASPLLAHLTIAETSVSYLLETNDADLATGKRTKSTLTVAFDCESDKEVIAPSGNVNTWKEAYKIKEPRK